MIKHQKFKETEIGMIPEDWEVVQIEPYLDKIIDYRGKTPKKSMSGIMTLSARSIKKGRIDYDQTYYISEKTFEQWEIRGKPKIGDVLLTTEGPLGEVAQLDKEGVAIAQRLLTLRGKERQLNNGYLKYFLMSPIGQNVLSARATGTTVQGIKQSEFRKILIVKPSFQEQSAIAKILSDLDSKIELSEDMNKTLEAIGQAIFKHWFVDFEFPDEHGRPYKSSGGEMVDSELGEIPKGWKVAKLGEYADVTKGCSYKSEELKESENALVTLKSINRGGGLNQEGYKEYIGSFDNKQTLSDGDIVVAQTDLTQNAEVVGRPAIISSMGKYKTLIASLDLQIVRPRDTLTRTFLYYLLVTESFHNHALSYTNGTTVLHLNKKAVPEYTFVVPSNNILEIFERTVSLILKKKINNEAGEWSLSQIRDILLPKLMSGKIRVPVEVS